MHNVLACAFGALALDFSHPRIATLDTVGYAPAVITISRARKVLWFPRVCFREGQGDEPRNIWPKARTRQGELSSSRPEAPAHVFNPAQHTGAAIKIDQEF